MRGAPKARLPTTSRKTAAQLSLDCLFTTRAVMPSWRMLTIGSAAATTTMPAAIASS